MNIKTRTSLHGGLVVAILLAARAPATADAAADLQSKEWRVRLAAVDALRKEGGVAVTAPLVKALRDDDWEVVEHAALALAEHGTTDATKALVDLALDGAILRTRVAAALALGKIDPEGAAKSLAKSLGGDSPVRAAQAIALVARSAGNAAGEQLRKAIDKAGKAKEPEVRIAVAGTLSAFPESDRWSRLIRAVNEEDPRFAVQALDEAVRAPDATYVGPLVNVVRQPYIGDVVLRRLEPVVVASFRAIADPKEREQRLKDLHLGMTSTREADIAARLASLVAALAATPAPAAPADGATTPAGTTSPAPADPAAKPAPAPGPAITADEAMAALEPALVHKGEEAGGGEEARAAAAKALAAIGGTKAFERASSLAASDAHPRVRHAALRAAVRMRGVEDEAARRVAVDRLGNDADAGVREEAAVLLGASKADGAPFDAPVEALAKALADADWTVAVAAAVSIGKTRSAAGVDPLRRQLDPKAVKDWKRRGAAVVGLGLIPSKDAVPAVISALVDKDPFVKRAALESLRRQTTRDIGTDRVRWDEWWAQFGAKHEFVDRDLADREAKKGAWAVEPGKVFEKVDVVMFQNREDHVETVFKKLAIDHRPTRASAVAGAELHPFAVFFANCSGEIHKDDVERLQWFVRVGGTLLASCSALQHVVATLHPDMLRKLPTKSQVVDFVAAGPVPGSHPLLEGAFTSPSSTYRLVDAHLIHVVAPERVEVLADSAELAHRWGGGTVAAWFPLGHGAVLDSVVHFDSPGLDAVTGLKTAAARMAYAIDHMGYGLAEARDLFAQRVFDSQTEAAKQVKDLSAFRLATNLVRQKRRGAF